jgi:hypothetical protein
MDDHSRWRLRRDKEQVRAKSCTLPEPAIPPRLYRQKSFTFRTRAPIRPRHSHLGRISAITGRRKIRRNWSLTARRFAGASTLSHALGGGRETHTARWSRDGVCCSRSDYRATINEVACQGRGLHPSSKSLRRGFALNVNAVYHKMHVVLSWERDSELSVKLMDRGKRVERHH